MELPIDARRAPFKPKYIQDETPMLKKWMVFGTDPKDGTHFVCDDMLDVFCGLSHDDAVRIVAARETFVNSVLSVLNKGE